MHVSRLQPRSTTSLPQRELGRTRPVTAPQVRAVDAFEAAPARRPVPAPLGRGKTGSEVASLQARLVARGFLRSQDMAAGKGVFGPRTEAAVRRLQLAHGLPTTGVADRRTVAALSERPLPAANEIADLPTVRHARPRPGFDPDATLTDDETMPIALPLEKRTGTL